MRCMSSKELSKLNSEEWCLKKIFALQEKDILEHTRGLFSHSKTISPHEIARQSMSAL
jgi:hypothetical protein